MIPLKRRTSAHRSYSIRFRLIAWLVLPVTVLFTVAGFFASSMISARSDQVFDRLLLGMAKSIEQRLVLRDGRLSLNMPYFTLDVMETASSEKMFYRVERQDGELLAGFRGLVYPEQALQTDDRSVRFYNTVFAGNQLRAVFLQIPGETPQSSVFISVAESLNSRNAFTEDLMQVLVLIALGVCLLLMLASAVAIQRGLRPLNRLAEQIRQRSEHDLTPLNVIGPIPKEVRPLVGSLHTLIERTRENIEHIQQFNADVSHQLRTPLAEIKTLTHMAEQALRDKTEESGTDVQQRLRQIQQIVNFMSRTTEQLLAYAKTRRSLLDRNAFRPMDLSDFCRRQMRLQAPRVYRAGGEISFEDSGAGSGVVEADPVLLAGLLNNLIDNALIYGTDSEKTVSIRVTVIREPAGSEEVWLTVEDDGPGIPEQQLSSVTERFVRLDQQTQGSGLGLSIVRQVCDAHGARMTLGKVPDGPGLRVRISFPLSAGEPDQEKSESLHP